MKNIIIEARIIRRELFIWLFMLVVAYLANIYAISAYGTSWSESYSSIGYVLVISWVLYALVCIIRLLVFLVRRLIGFFV